MDESEIPTILIAPSWYRIDLLLVDAKLAVLVTVLNDTADLEIDRLTPLALADSQARSEIWLLEIERMEEACTQLLDICVDVWCGVQGNPLSADFLKGLLKHVIEPRIDNFRKAICTRLTKRRHYDQSSLAAACGKVDDRAVRLKHKIKLNAEILWLSHSHKQGPTKSIGTPVDTRPTKVATIMLIDNDFVTVHEAAQILRVTPRTIQNWNSEGKLHKFSRNKYLTSSIKRLLEGS